MSTARSRCLSLAGSLGKRSSTSVASGSLSLRLFLGRGLPADALLLGLVPNILLRRLPDSIAMTVEDNIKSGGAWNVNENTFNYALALAQRMEVESVVWNRSA